MTAILISTTNLNANLLYPGSGSQAWVMPGVTISNNFSFVIKMTGSTGGISSDGTILALWTGTGLQMTGNLQNLYFGYSSIYRSDAAVGSPVSFRRVASLRSPTMA